MIPKERLMELLTQAGNEIGIIPKRLPAGWVRFAELVEREALLVRGIVDYQNIETGPSECKHPSWANVRLTTGDGTPVDYCNLCKRNQLA